MNQKHLVRIQVEVKHIKLSVKFPCKVSFELQVDSNQIDSTKQYELIAGECSPGETVQLQFSTLFNSKKSQYQQQKVVVSVKMITNSGIIPAGRIYFNPLLKEPLQINQISSTMEKCPDKLAQVSFTYRFDILKKEENLSVMPVASNQSIYKSKYELLNHSKSSKTFTGNGSLSKINSSYQFQRVKTPAKVDKEHPIDFDTFEKSIVKNRTDKADLYKNHSRVIPPLNFREGDSSFGDPIDRAQQQKELARLRAQVKILKSQQFNQKEYRLREQNKVFQAEIEKARQNVRLYERRERELTIQNKESKDELDKTRIKINNLESTKAQLELQLADKQKQVRELNIWKKKHQSQYIDLQTQLVSLIKRLSHKDTNFQEQLKKITQKLTSSQADKQKLLFDQNAALLKIEEMERKNQTALKDKEKKYQEEKNKLAQLNQTLTQESQKISTQMLALENTNNNLTKYIQQQQQIGKIQESTLRMFEDKVNKLVVDLKKQTDMRQDLERDLLAFKGIEEQKNSMKKKNVELLNELAKNSQKFERVSSELQLSVEKIQDLEASLSQRIRQKQVLSAKNALITKQLNQLKQEQQKVMREAETLSVQNISYQQKFNNLRAKMERQRYAWQCSQKKLNVDISALSRGRQLLDNEVEEQKSVIKRQEDEINSLELRLKKSEETIMNLNESAMKKQQALIRAQQKIQQYDESIFSFEVQIQNFTTKEKTQYIEIKAKQEQLFCRNKQLLNIQNELYLLSERNKQLEKQLEQIKGDAFQRTKHLQRQISKQNEDILTMTIELSSTKQQLQQCQQMISSKGVQNKDLSGSIQKYAQDLASKNFDLNEKKEQLKDLEDRLQQNLKENENLKIRIVQVEYQQQKIKTAWSQYRNDTAKAMNQFFVEIGKKKQSSEPSFYLNFPDQSLSIMQTEAVSKINNAMARYENTILELTEEKNILENENQSCREQLIGLQFQNQRLSSESTSEINKITSKLTRQIQQGKLLRNKLQEEKVQLLFKIEKLNNTVQSKEVYIEDLKTTIEQFQKQLGQKKAETVSLEEEVLRLKSAEIKYKVSMEGQSFQQNELNQAEAEKMSLLQQELENKLAAAEKIIQDRDSAIKKLEMELIESEYNYQKAKATIEQLESKLNKATSQGFEYHKQIRHIQEELRQSQEQLTKSKHSVDRESIKTEQLQLRLSDTFNNLTDAEIELERLRNQIVQLKMLNQQLQEKYFEKDEKIRSTLEKEQRQTLKQNETIIQLNTELELTAFKVKQQQEQISSLEEQLKNIEEELLKRKESQVKQDEQTTSYRNRQLSYVQQIQLLKADNNDLKQQTKRSIEMKRVLEEQISILQQQIEQLAEKNKEVDKLKLKMEEFEYESTKQRQLQGAKSTNSLIPNRYQRNTSVNQRKRIRQLQSLLQKREFDLVSQRHQSSLKFEQQRQALAEENMRLRQQLRSYEQYSPVQAVYQEVQNRNGNL